MQQNLALPSKVVTIVQSLQCISFHIYETCVAEILKSPVYVKEEHSLVSVFEDTASKTMVDFERIQASYINKE